MFVTLTDNDEVVAETKFGETDIKIVWSDDDDRFSVIWRRSDGRYQLMWRGTFEACIKEFGEIVGDTYTDHQHQEAQARHDRMAEQAPQV